MESIFVGLGLNLSELECTPLQQHCRNYVGVGVTLKISSFKTLWSFCVNLILKQAVDGRPTWYASAPAPLTFCPYIFSALEALRNALYKFKTYLFSYLLKVVSESRKTWATSVPILVFLGLCVLDLGPMYATDRRQTDVRRQTRIIA